MATEIKCIYEDGYLKPIEPIDLTTKKKIVIKVIGTDNLKEKLKKGYLETSSDSLKIADEWIHLEEE